MRSSTNATTVAVAKSSGERGWRVGKRCLCVVFWLTRRSRVHGKKSILGHPIERATSYCLLPGSFRLRDSKNAFKIGSVKIRKFAVTAFYREESTHRKKKQPRDLSDAGQKSWELTTPPEPPSTYIQAVTGARGRLLGSLGLAELMGLSALARTPKHRASPSRHGSSWNTGRLALAGTERVNHR